MAIKAIHQETSFFVGDLVKVQQKILESGKERTQNFEGIVIAIKGEGENRSITVRRIGADRIGVERVWPLNSPWVLKVDVVRSGKPRRAKLYYLRNRVGSQALKVKPRTLKVVKPKRKTPSAAKSDHQKTGK